jgi:hypothetical protein
VATILVSLPSGAGVVRTDDGLALVTNQVAGGGGAYVREEDPFHPVKSWADEDRCVVGGLLPPGAISAEVIDDAGTRVTALVANGAYAALLEQPNDGHEPIVCCRDEAGEPVRRPWADDYLSVRVTDAEEPCPACGAIDYDEYTPFEDWRGGRGGPDGTTIPNPVVSCRICGHEVTEGTFFAISSEPDESEDEVTRAARIARDRAHARKQRWLMHTLTLRATSFPIYAAVGWPAHIGGSGSQGDDLTEIRIYHYETADAAPYQGDPPRLVITTKREPRCDTPLHEARQTLEEWIRGDAAGAWPEVSRPAVTLWLRARARESRGAALGAVASEQPITIDGSSASTLMLSGPAGPRDPWVAVARHADLAITIAARDLDPASLRLEPIADPAAQLLGPEPPTA